MIELELSVMARTPQADNELKQLLAIFETRHNLKVNLQIYPWETGRSELVKVAMYRHGPDLSEIGTTWLADLVSMNALRSFSTGDIAVLGGREPYAKTAWERSKMVGDVRTWSIPWLLDPTAVYYRRDLLHQANIDESNAFSTPTLFEQTMQKLKASGVVTPLTIPLHRHRYLNVHRVASWIWSEGGDIVSADGKRVLFSQPEGRAGIRNYINLYHYLSPAAFNPNDQAFDRLFYRGDAAVLLGGAASAFQSLYDSPAVAANVGAAMMPGASFVGGSDLVMWKHSKNEEAALALVNFLNSAEVQNRYTRLARILPVRVDSLNSPEIAGNAILRGLAEIANTGRSFPCVPLWGLVEEKLDNAMIQIWTTLLGDPRADLELMIHQNIDPLAPRLNVTLGQGTRR